MPTRWLPHLIARIRALAVERRVRFTAKALRELSNLGLGLDQDDGCDILSRLSPADFRERLLSDRSGEFMYVFKPVVAATTLYLKVVIRGDCIVVSLHEDEVRDEE